MRLRVRVEEAEIKESKKAKQLYLMLRLRVLGQPECEPLWFCLSGDPRAKHVAKKLADLCGSTIAFGDLTLQFETQTTFLEKMREIAFRSTITVDVLPVTRFDSSTPTFEVTLPRLEDLQPDSEDLL